MRAPWRGLFAQLVLRDITVHVALTVVAGLLLFIAVDTVETGNMARNAEDAGMVLELELTSLPIVFQQIAALAALIGTCTAVGGLVRRGEVVALFGAGASPGVVLKPALLAGLVWAATYAGITEWVCPWAHARTSQLRRTLGITSHRPESGRPQSWFAVRDRIFRVNALEDPDGEALAGILILRVEAGRLVERWDAERLVWSDAEGWAVERAVHRRFEGDDGLSTQRVARQPVPLTERPEDFVRSVGIPERLALGSLASAVAARTRLGQPTEAHRLELYRRAAQPLTLWLAVALGAAAMLAVGRRPTLAGALGVGALLGFSLWILDEVAVALASTQALPPGPAALVPLVLVGAAAAAGWARAYRRGITD